MTRPIAIAGVWVALGVVGAYVGVCFGVSLARRVRCFGRTHVDV